MPIYSWCSTPIQIEITDENAEAYNRVIDAYIKLSLTPIPLKEIQVAEEDVKMWEKVLSIIEIMVELNGGSLPYRQNDMNVARLVKV